MVASTLSEELHTIWSPHTSVLSPARPCQAFLGWGLFMWVLYKITCSHGARRTHSSTLMTLWEKINFLPSFIQQMGVRDEAFDKEEGSGLGNVNEILTVTHREGYSAVESQTLTATRPNGRQW